MKNYIAIVHKEANTDFGVSFPDFPGCVTAGQTVDEAKDFAQEALTLHIKGMVEDGDQLPAPSTLEDIMADAAYADTVAYLVVSIPDTKPRTVRVNITVPEMTLKQIDAAAKKKECHGPPFFFISHRMRFIPIIGSRRHSIPVIGITTQLTCPAHAGSENPGKTYRRAGSGAAHLFGACPDGHRHPLAQPFAQHLDPVPVGDRKGVKSALND
jgi:predicted RNase H-like HicB family nuclease